MKRAIATRGIPFTEGKREWPEVRPTESLTDDLKGRIQAGFPQPVEFGLEHRNPNGISVTQVHMAGQTVMSIKNLQNP